MELGVDIYFGGLLAAKILQERHDADLFGVPNAPKDHVKFLIKPSPVIKEVSEEKIKEL